MAVCNIFHPIEKETGNFLIFSQYSEDLTKKLNQCNNLHLIPNKFIACDIEYINHDNSTITKLLQDNFENGCAICKSDSEYSWDASKSSNLFWNALIDNKLITIDKDNIVKQIHYIGDINMQSHETIDGMGYSELYCYIPNEASSEIYKFTESEDSNKNIAYQSKEIIEGYTIDEYDRANIDDIITYNPDLKYDIVKYQNSDAKSFNINTIIILYKISYFDENGIYIVHENIPMGIYFTGLIDNGVMQNSIKKYVTSQDIYHSGTSYGLRICSRFVSYPSTNLKIDNITSTDNNYSDLCRVLTQMSITQSKMDDIIKQNYNQNQNYKELYSIFKNSQINVPYVKTINGVNHWFVNGKHIYTDPQLNDTCIPYSDEEMLNFIQDEVLIDIKYSVNNDSNIDNVFDLFGEKNINITWDITRDGENKFEPDNIEFKLYSKQYDQNSYKSISSLNGGNNYEFIANLNNPTDYRADVIINVKNKTFTNSMSCHFVLPSYFGQLEVNESDNKLIDDVNLLQKIETLDKFYKKDNNQTYTYTSIDDIKRYHICFAYPAYYGELNSIIDNFGYNYINDFDHKTIELNGLEYHIYIDKEDKTSYVNDYTLKFIG